MIGHEPLIQMRLQHMRPAVVYIHDKVHQLARDWHAPKSISGIPLEAHDPHISIEPKDAIRSLDMRFLVGLEVRVASDDEKRAKALFDVCKKYGASRVVGCHTPDTPRSEINNWWLEIYEEETKNG